MDLPPDLPPTYGDDCESANAPAAVASILPPATLYVAGRFIHSSDPQAPPLYELSHSVGFLKETDRSVRVERLDYAVRAQNGLPRVTTRRRHIFNLKHPTLAEWSAFAYHAETTSRDALGGLALETFHPRRFSTARGYRVLRTARGPPPQRQLVGTELLFAAAPPRDRGRTAVAFEWTDARGQLVAREVDEDGLLRMVIGVEMAAQLRDALVTAWIARIWWELARGNHQGNRWEDAKRILNTKHAELSAYRHVRI